jgi:acetyl-CoA acetyltransferase
MSLKDRYAIVGVGHTPQGKVPDRTALSFHLEACANAIRDAGLRREKVDGLICYRHFQPAPGERDVTPYAVAHHLGLQPAYLSQDANCSRSHLVHAIGALEAGLCRYVVLSYGGNGLSGGVMQRMLVEDAGDNAAFGHFGAVGGYALAARRAMHTCGTGPETWQQIAVGQRKWANLNPKATFYSTPLSASDYMDSDYLVEPFRLLDCCLISDGGRACVITTAERARDLKQPPVLIMGLGQHNPSVAIEQSDCMDGPTGAWLAGRQAFQMAGIGIDAIDACQIYDCFTYTVEITLQDYGFFGPGGGRAWFAGGTIEPGGRMPVNTSGGQLSEAYFMGLTPLTEAVLQLQGGCGARQLGPATRTKTPEIILCSDNGMILQTHSCMILRRS